MKGDFSRVTFDARKHFSRVLMQQGRVTLDADPNEQTDILLHYLRALAADLIGPHAAPAALPGFELKADDTGKLLLIGKGRYYVDGILVENDDDCPYTAQPGYEAPDDDVLVHEMAEPGGKTFWVYLDVWERHVTWLDDGTIREVALGGPDTCTRSQVVWRVRALEFEAPTEDDTKTLDAQLATLKKKQAALAAKIKQAATAAAKAKLQVELDKLKAQAAALEAQGSMADCAGPLKDLMPVSSASMSAQVDPGLTSDDPCVLSPESSYRGAENQLYRVEIHVGGKAGTATFKWSRDNGSVASAWLGTSGNDLSVASGIGFKEGCWVELIDETKELLGQPGVLVKLAKVEGSTLSVDPASVAASDALALSESMLHPKVRRWDQVEVGDNVLLAGAVPLVETDGVTANWIDLEDGIQVQFTADGTYRTGDYWLIPARVATGGIGWPVEDGKPLPIAPHGVVHHYAPLGFVSWKEKLLNVDSCRCTFEPLAICLKDAEEDEG